MKISVIGTGYVGLVTGACFAETGNDVVCVDTDTDKISRLTRGDIPFYEPGLSDIVSRNVGEGRLAFRSDTVEAVAASTISFICVGTPSREDGSADLSFVLEAAADIAKGAQKGSVVTIKSTVPVGTNDTVRKHLLSLGRSDLRVISNPEFLREGTAVQDCLLPDRIVLGTDDKDAASLLGELYQPFVRTAHPILLMDVRSAEMTKYAANALLAMRISFINEISMLCDRVKANVSQVRAGIGSDHRIGMQYLFPSLGFGGSCFPKDVRALAALAREVEIQPRLLDATLDVNEAQKQHFLRQIRTHFGEQDGLKGKRIAVWGLSFKAKTDDLRESPALTVVDGLLKEGAKLTVYDPVSMPNTEKQYGDRLTYAKSAFSALEGAEALCVLTEWNQFRHPDFSQVKTKMRAPVIFDGRNLYDPAALQRSGFTYYSVGRPKT